MSWEFWIGTGTIVIAIGTVILVGYAARTDIGRLRLLVGAWRARLGTLRNAIVRITQQELRFRLPLVVTSVLTTIWVLAASFAIASSRDWDRWVWPLRTLAAAFSLMGLLIALLDGGWSAHIPFDATQRTRHPVVETPPLAVVPSVADHGRRDDLLRRTTAIAVALLSYLNDPDVFYIAWDQLKPYNNILALLRTEGVDLDVFEIPQSWSYYANGPDETVVSKGRIIPQLEALVSYLPPLQQSEYQADSIPF